MKKTYYKPVCEAFLCDEELLAPGSITTPSGIVTETPGGTDEIDPNPGSWTGPGIDNSGQTPGNGGIFLD